MYKLSAHNTLPHDALTAASAALTTLSFLIADRSELSLAAHECFGLSVMLEAIHDDMNKVADIIESDRLQRGETDSRWQERAAAEYERGYQNGVADGRDQGERKRGRLEEISNILSQATSTDADGGAPVPKLTEESKDGGAEGAKTA